MLKQGQRITYSQDGKVLMELSPENESYLDLSTQRYIRLAQPYESKNTTLVLPVLNEQGGQSRYIECGVISGRKIEKNCLVFITHQGEFRIKYEHIDLEALLKEVSNAKANTISRTAKHGSAIPEFPWKD